MIDSRQKCEQVSCGLHDKRSRLRETALLSMLFLILNLALPHPLQAQTLISGSSNNVSSYSSEDNGSTLAGDETDSLIDQKAKVFNVAGKVFVLRQDTEAWVTLHENDVITEGDKIKTEGEASVEIYYDEFYLNFIRVEPSSEITFTTIEPTRINLDDGGIFNNLDGLVAGSDYEVVTPTSIAGVRGTQFLREYNRDDGSDNTFVNEGTVDVNPFMEDGKTPDTANVFQVRANQSMIFDAASVRNHSYGHLKATPMKASNQQRLTSMRANAKRKLNQFAGGEQKVKQAQNRFQAIKNNPGKMNHVQERLRGRSMTGMSRRDNEHSPGAAAAQHRKLNNQGQTLRNNPHNQGQAPRNNQNTQGPGQRFQGQRDSFKKGSSQNRQSHFRNNGQNQNGPGLNSRQNTGHNGVKGSSLGKNKHASNSQSQNNKAMIKRAHKQSTQGRQKMSQNKRGTNASRKRAGSTQRSAPKR